MEAGHQLKALLQLQLGSDSYAVLHLPYILASLTPECLVPSAHSSKWTARINSLLHSKAADARWAGLCLAHKSSVLSKPMMIDCAQSWIGVALPILSVQSTPILSAAIRLLRVIFSGATDVPEFQRQVATPNVSKFTAALIPLAEQHLDAELKILIMSTLTLIIPLYPTLHKTSHSALSALALKFLNGNPVKPTNKALAGAASRLYSVLHFTGGKVGAANLWRKSVEETLAFGWTAFFSLRTTFHVEGQRPLMSMEEPLSSIPLNLDRVRLSVLVLCDLLKTTTHRPVQVPLGPLIKFAVALLSCTTDDQIDQHVDTSVRAMQIAVTPQIWNAACELISCIANCVGHHLSSSLNRLVTCVAFHLEQRIGSSERLAFLGTLQVLLTKCQPLHSTITATRLAKAVLPLTSIVLAKQADLPDTENETSGRSKKSKKRAREFEGDEIFKLSRDIVCPTAEDGEVLLAAFSVLRLILLNPNLSPTMHSISCRVVLSILLALPQMAPASLSPDSKLYPLLLEQVQELNAEMGAGSTSRMSKSLGLVLSGTLGNSQIQRDVEVLLHPRLPPLVRSLPFVESLALFRAEESQEEMDTRQSLGLGAPETEDSAMPDVADTLPPPKPDVAPIPAPTPAPAPIAVPAIPSSLPPPPPIAKPVVSQPTPVVTEPPPKVSYEAPPARIEVDDGDKNEEMPSIDMDSDSDSE
ncbi:rRNA processing/ribosome biogenesis-domain-containing protein [Roridomyces roridus]|uniref:Pre-rRNA-processing protein RIX1 n=1 Tax=Roridomyces roridus TaxID=1738132 RepID=A0AAD7C525_9AGAR|nr:rRNA processing/ribosome biogenesis-domain-containing protein [Roridomyces roridus]